MTGMIAGSPERRALGVAPRIEATRLYILNLDGPMTTAVTRRRLAFFRGELAALHHLWSKLSRFDRWLSRRLFVEELDAVESGVTMAMLQQESTPWCPLHDVPRAAFDLRCTCLGGD